MVRSVARSPLLVLTLTFACSGNGPESAGNKHGANAVEPNRAASLPTKSTEHEPSHAGPAAHADDGCVAPDHEDGSACPHDGDDAAADSDSNRFGGDFRLAATSRRDLSAAVASLADIGDTPVQVTGWVGEVCQRKGCWMVLNDEQVHARVLMKGHFSVPTDSTGRAAIVEGTLSERQFTEAQAKHLADDGGQDASTVAGPRTEYVLTATAVELLPRS